MRLESLTYSEHDGTSLEWRIKDLRLGAKNLIVGKNASGKTRTLNVIGGLAKLLAGLQQPVLSGNYDVMFVNEEHTLRYQIKFEEEQVIEERVTVDKKIMLERGKEGSGTIWAEQIDGGKEISFQTPPSEIAAVVRRDFIQHSFLEPLYSWGATLRHFYFGTPLGKDHLPMFVKNDSMKIDDRNPNAVALLYHQAVSKFPDDFQNAIITDMGRLDYEITEVGLQPPVSIRFVNAPGEVVGLYVKEKRLLGITDQNSMSQGMFRALSILIHANYSQMEKSATCILIDDIGEGLDFDRSCRLIDLLREKAVESDIQLILSTNDRFVMNRVPLEEWLVLQQQGNHVSVRNYENSRELFEEFKFTGLSNFSFLEMDFVNGPPAEEAALS